MIHKIIRNEMLECVQSKYMIALEEKEWPLSKTTLLTTTTSTMIAISATIVLQCIYNAGRSISYFYLSFTLHNTA